MSTAVAELRTALAHLGASISATRIQLQRDIERDNLNATVYEMRDATGQPILAPLLAAHVTGLAALVHLKYSEPRPGGSRG